MEPFSSMLGFLKHIAKMQSISITHHHHPLPCLGISRDWMMGGAGSHGVVRAATTPLLDGWLDAWLDDIPPPPGGGYQPASHPPIHSGGEWISCIHQPIHPLAQSIPSITPVNININLTIQYQHHHPAPPSTIPSVHQPIHTSTNG